ALPPRFITTINECPLTSAVARFQSQNNTHITNMRHEQVTMDQLSHFVLQNLDGTRNRGEIREMIRELVEQGKVQVKFEKVQPEYMDEFLDQVGDIAISGMFSLALLVG